MNARNALVKDIKGFGKKYTEVLNSQGVFTIKDLFLTFPYRYESFAIDDIHTTKTDKVCFVGTVVSSLKYQHHKSNLNSLTFSMAVDGEIIKVIIFNRKYLINQIAPKSQIKVSGKWNYFKRELVATNIFPNNLTTHFESFYHLKDITSSVLKKAVKIALEEGYKIEEYLPQYIMDKNKFSDINTLIDKIHNPKSFKDISECRRRKKYEEILEFFIRVNYFKSLKEKSVREPIKYDIEEVKRFISTIPFELTSDQKLVCNEIFRDFKTNHPLNRLVQGDVGSGKTIVALIAAYAMVTAKKQVVLMAPTEILAKQHYEYFKRFLAPFNVNIGLLTGATSKANRNILLQDIRTGNLDIIIGTHALFYEEIEYKKLGLAIIDEQHRFGVKARNSLLGERVIDALYLSATPIPRTLGLTLFGDLNISSIKTARVDKKRITTEIVSIKDTNLVLDKVKKELDLGHQVYFVVSSIENDYDEGRFDISDMVKLLSLKIPGCRVGELHGRMKDKEKNEVMNSFINKEIDIIVSTTVIEVGISVDNATVMVVMDAHNFGLSQLHQLRGRVGRGNLEGSCYLVTNDLDKERLQVLTESNDGFYLSEVDLRLRGPGDYFSIRQSGMPSFVFADFEKDYDMFKYINEDAAKMFVLQEYDSQIKKYIDNVIRQIDINTQLN